MEEDFFGSFAEFGKKIGRHFLHNFMAEREDESFNIAESVEFVLQCSAKSAVAIFEHLQISPTITEHEFAHATGAIAGCARGVIKVLTDRDIPMDELTGEWANRIIMPIYSDMQQRARGFRRC